MAIRFIDKTNFVVQVQRGGERKTKRGSGTEADAKRIETLLAAELDHGAKLAEAARLLGIEGAGEAETAPVPTVRKYFEDRWIEHARIVQNDKTRRTQRNAFNYLLYYLGDHPLDVLLRPAEINAFIEKMKETGPMMFAKRKDGKPWRRRGDEFTNATVNKCLQCLRALLNLAHTEGILAAGPRIDLLPTDDSTPVLPPTDEELQKLLDACDHYAPRAPLLREIVEFTAETGMRRGELFHLTWRSVDLPRGAVRVEMQSKARMVNGRPWKPKHNKFREIPLSARARAILEKLLASGRRHEHDLVFPNRSGAPFEREDGAPKGSGHGWFPDAAEAAGLKGKVVFHSLRHLFAVRLLTRGVPITVVSELLGHSDINLTVKRYGRFSSDAKIKWDAVKVLDRVSDAAHL